jgi:hypothetical protein
VGAEYAAIFRREEVSGSAAAMFEDIAALASLVPAYGPRFALVHAFKKLHGTVPSSIQPFCILISLFQRWSSIRGQKAAEGARRRSANQQPAYAEEEDVRCTESRRSALNYHIDWRGSTPMRSDRFAQVLHRCKA